MSNKPDHPEKKESLSRSRMPLRYLNVLLYPIVGTYFIWLSRTPESQDAILPPWSYLLIGVAMCCYGIFGIIRLWRKR